jgi:predicted nucleic acid-binding protein
VYLVDTNVISAAAAAPSRPVPPAVVEWMDLHSASLFISAVTVAEIEDGIAKSRREGAARKSADLAAWLETILHLYSDRVLAFDVPTARIAGAMADRARGQGQAPGLADIIIAATAQHHALTILSRNLRHFEPLGVVVIDPFMRLPSA